ncbi:MAG: hypothetical protein HYY01_03330 [Chloroflexi bacterium]|nr:hypothetical protein [Chloroflexota bacterium]
MSTSGQLYSIQERDLALDARREELKQVLARLADESALARAREQLAQAQQELAQAEKAQRDAEGEVEDLRAKIAPVEDKMYSGTVTSPKELVAMQEDVQSLKARLRKLEDGVLDTMLQVEAARETASQRQSHLQDMETHRVQEKEDLSQRKATLDSEMVAIEADRHSLTSGVPEQALELYGRLRLAKQGRAVAKVEGGMCQGCRISLPTQHWQQARAGAGLVQCTSCSRILHVS